ncbi:MAG: molybdenum ABC transporter ATP-binding protein [Nitrospinae bacterium]|nr:molybdenum ABC transporter ATP-binding protein [Nitrospinota bacterium]
MLLDLEFKIIRDTFRLEADLEIRRPVTGLFGPSGSGKTTILSVLAGLAKPDSGRVELDGQVLFDSETGLDLPPERRGIGYVFQDGQLFPHLSVKSNLLYGHRLASPESRRFQPDHVIDLLEIGPLLSRRPRNLSGGEKQRVAIGRALLASPRLLLLDEPLASLDEGLKRQILPFLKRVKDEIKIPMIYVSHPISEILQLTDMLVAIEKGKILGHGPFLEVMKKESILNLAESLGLENVLPAEIVRHDRELGFTTVKINHHELRLPFSVSLEGDTVYVAVRPEDIVLATRPVQGTSVQNQLEGRVQGITRVGTRALVQVDIGAPVLAEVTLKAVHDLALKEGDPIFCLIKSRSFTYLSGRSV